MGYTELTFKMATDYAPGDLEGQISRKLKIRSFHFQVLAQSLDARQKNKIHWLVKAGITSPELPGPLPEKAPELKIPRKQGEALVVGSGPAGFFAALVLQTAGIKTTLIDRGRDVDSRAGGISRFEKEGLFDPLGNYAFGEGGAGTFSDGKLTSRSKGISREKQFILREYIAAGGPEEIAWLAHPHLGSDNLKVIVKTLRRKLEAAGGKVFFETMLEDLIIREGQVTGARTSRGTIEARWFVLAPGHSAFETYRMMIRRGVPFRVKNFALGSRVEHPQELINRAQWGRSFLPGVKAAEYRLTTKTDSLPVYTFCMCPGGIVVPAAPYPEINIVNGMSLYRRDGHFANAACVAGVNPHQLLGREVEPLEALEWLETLECSFFACGNNHSAPFCGVENFIRRKMPSRTPETSYPLGLTPAPLWELLPREVSLALGEGLKVFSRKIKGFETGTLLGLESKTSGILQVCREKGGLCQGFSNLYLAGEGSGYSGGIISSAADGIKCALNLLAF